MAMSFCHALQTPLSFPSLLQRPLVATKKTPLITASLPSSSSPPPPSSSSSPSVSMELHDQGHKKFMEFPYVTAPHRELMQGVVSMVEDRLGSNLLPCNLPLDVQICQNETGTSKASLHIRSCHQSSLVDFVLGSWLHCQLPTGTSLNITSLSAYLKPISDAPNLLLELIRSSPTSAVFILDLPPRKDLIVSPDYLQTFYENTNLENLRKLLAELPEVQPYFSSSLFIRSVVSPTAIVIRIGTGTGELMDEIVKDHLNPVVKEVVGIWLENCACKEREVKEEEKLYLKKRDDVIKRKTIEVDLGSNFPRLFGDKIAGRVLGAIKEVYNV